MSGNLSVAGVCPNCGTRISAPSVERSAELVRCNRCGDLVGDYHVMWENGRQIITCAKCAYKRARPAETK